MVADRIPLPFKIFSGEGGTDLDIKVGLIKGGVETAEEEEVAAVVVVEFILTLAPSAFTRLGIFSKLTTGTGTLLFLLCCSGSPCLLHCVLGLSELIFLDQGRSSGFKKNGSLGIKQIPLPAQ